MPYVERINGNICVKRGDFEKAVGHYNKALLSLKMLFESGEEIVTQRDAAIKLIREIEIPTCLNLAHCFNKMGRYHYAIKYTTQALENEPENCKALFRRAVAYLNIGELSRCKNDLMTAHELKNLDAADKAAINGAFKDLKAAQERAKIKEKEAAERMFKFPSQSAKAGDGEKKEAADKKKTET